MKNKQAGFNAFACAIMIIVPVFTGPMGKDFALALAAIWVFIGLGYYDIL